MYKEHLDVLFRKIIQSALWPLSNLLRDGVRTFSFPLFPFSISWSDRSPETHRAVPGRHAQDLQDHGRGRGQPPQPPRARLLLCESLSLSLTDSTDDPADQDEPREGPEGRGGGRVGEGDREDDEGGRKGRGTDAHGVQGLCAVPPSRRLPHPTPCRRLERPPLLWLPTRPLHRPPLPLSPVRPPSLPFLSSSPSFP